MIQKSLMLAMAAAAISCGEKPVNTPADDLGMWFADPLCSSLNSTYRDDGRSFSLDYPADWNADDRYNRIRLTDPRGEVSLTAFFEIQTSRAAIDARLQQIPPQNSTQELFMHQSRSAVRWWFTDSIDEIQCGPAGGDTPSDCEVVGTRDLLYLGLAVAEGLEIINLRGVAPANADPALICTIESIERSLSFDQ